MRNNRSKRAETISAIADNKIIAILRRPDEDTLIDGMKALYRAGIRLAEVTFDRSGKYDKEYTARMIRKLNEEFGGRMLIGAGTVMSVEDVMTAYEAGARFMISPNANADVIKLTRDLGLVSIPAAMTPSEIAFACECGADFVKLFPANQFSLRYLKDVTAPISEAKLLAVGGVDAANAKDFIDAGFAGVGIGTAIYNGKLAKEGKFDELYENAKKIVEAVK
ncbi:MAG: bifunctional 4-hydroxy-2-oxoglutarate aldolase/2-dehydro-3-deoxy-phosphogluconate aldolase [Firmicutes bacterium]|nr:bifunctional 4-hydroxy-2-oxoglutarate aldolase/2-dehydro-3-deoxy-phosphogluconate aldolase [Candidatus Colimorpha enterica]